jgi:hypothetical protein
VCSSVIGGCGAPSLTLRRQSASGTAASAGGGHFNVFADVAVDMRVAALAGSINQAKDRRNTTTDETTGRSDRAESRPNKAGERES